MKNIKKVISLILTLLILFSSVEVVAFATYDHSLALNIDDDYAIAGNNAVGNVLSDLMNNEEDKNKDNNPNEILDLYLENGRAYVTFETEIQADIYVAVYEEESKQMVGSGKVTVYPDEKETIVEIDCMNWPEYFIVRAFLLDYKTAKPLCKQFTNPYYTKEFEEFFSKTIYDFSEEEVINLDSDPTNNFVVLKEGAKTVEATGNKNNLVTIDAEKGIIRVKNPDSEMLSLKSNDILHYIYGTGQDDYEIVCVDRIVKDGSDLEIYCKDAAPEEILQYARIEQAVTTSDSEYVDAENFRPYNNSVQSTNLRKARAKTKISVADIPEREAGPSLTFKLHDNDDIITGEIKAKVSVTFKLYFSVNIDFYEIFGVPVIPSEFSPYIDFKFSFKFDSHFNVTVKGKLDLFELELEKISIPLIPGLDFVGRPTFVGEVSAAIILDFIFVREIGTTFKTGEGKRDINDSNSDFKPDLSSEVQVKIGLELEMGLCAIKIVNLVLTGEMGVKLTCVPWSFQLDKDIKHLCPECISADVKLYGELGLKVNIELKIKIKSLEIINEEYEIVKVNFVEGEIPILEGYMSNITGKFVIHWNETCPNIGYRVSFSVVDSASNPVANAMIGSDTTDDQGKRTDFYKKGNYSFVVTASEYEDSTVSFVVNNSALDLKIVLNKEGEEPPVDPDNPSENPNDPSTGDGITWTYNTTTKVLDIEGRGDIADYQSYGAAPWYTYHNEIEQIKIASGVTSIGDFAFAQCAKLKNVSIPDSVTSIGMGAFYSCSSLESIDINDSVVEIGDYAYFDCYSADSIYLGNTLKEIGSYAFSQCTSLTEVTIPQSVQTIKYGAFGGCNALKSIYFNSSNCTIDSSSYTIHSGATIYAKSGSTAQTYATKNSRNFVNYSSKAQRFSKRLTSSNYNSNNSAKKYYAKEFGTLNGSEYILMAISSDLVTTKPSNSQLMYIDQYTGDDSGRIDIEFIPKSDLISHAYLIGDFSDGATIKEVKLTDNPDELEGDPSVNCSHICHKTGFMGFIYKIIRIFWKLFRIHQTCECGVKHY